MILIIKQLDRIWVKRDWEPVASNFKIWTVNLNNQNLEDS